MAVLGVPRAAELLLLQQFTRYYLVLETFIIQLDNDRKSANFGKKIHGVLFKFVRSRLQNAINYRYLNVETTKYHLGKQQALIRFFYIYFKMINCCIF